MLEAVDTETAAELSQQECAALIKVMELRNNLTDKDRKINLKVV